MELPIHVDKAYIATFCQEHHLIKLAFFGSVLTDRFGSDSDVDVLVTFAADARWSLMDWADMVDELEEIFARRVDLVEQQGLRNPFRRKAILDSAEVIHAA